MADATATKASQGKTPTKVKGRSPEEPLQTQSTNPHNHILSLQQMTGNQAVGRLLQSENSRESTSITNLPPAVQSVLGHSEGQPLDTTTRIEMESRFNHNFSQVRVHSGAVAEQSTRKLNAKAYTFGQNIVFGHGKFVSGTAEGRHLLAHELAHVVQQSRGGASPILDANAPHEVAAASAASSFINSAAAVSVSGATGVGIAREPEGAAQDTHTAKRRLVKAMVELDRLDQLAKFKTDDKALKPEKTLRAYDAINSALKTASASNDKTLITEAERLKARFDGITHNTPAARNVDPFQQHPLASKDPMSREEAHTTNTAQRGFEAGLPAGKIAGVREEIRELEDELARKPKAERAKQIRSKIASLNRRIAISTPTLKEAQPLQDLLKTEKDEAKRNAIQKHLRKIDKKYIGKKVALSDLTGGSLGHSGATYVTIQIVGSPPKKELITTIQARNEGDGKRHAEVVIRDRLKALPDKERLKNATMIITGDQEVCRKCAPVMHEFADKHQMASPLTNTTHAPGLTSAGKLSGKDLRAKPTTLKTSDPKKVHAIESAQRKAGVIGSKDKIKLKHIQKPLARPSKDDGGDDGHDHAPKVSKSKQSSASSQPSATKAGSKESAPKTSAKSTAEAPAKPAATGAPKPPTSTSAAKPSAKVAAPKAVSKPPTSSKAVAKPAVSPPAESPPPASITPTPGGTAPSAVGTQTKSTASKAAAKPATGIKAPSSASALDADASSTTAVQVATKQKATKQKPSDSAAKAAAFSPMPNSPAPAPTKSISPTPKPFAPTNQANRLSAIAKPSLLADAKATQAIPQATAPTAVAAPKPPAATKAAPSSPAVKTPVQVAPTPVSPTPKPPVPAAQAVPVNPPKKPPTAVKVAPALAIPIGGSPSPAPKPSAPAAKTTPVSPPAKSPPPKQSAPPKAQNKGSIADTKPSSPEQGNRPPATRRGPTIKPVARPDGSITANVSQIPGTSPARYEVTVRVMLGGTLSACATQSGKNGQIGANASVSGSLTWSDTYDFSEQEKNDYLAAVNGNTASSYQEIAAANLWAKGNQVQAKKILLQLGAKPPKAEDFLKLRVGESQSFSAEAGVQGGVSGSVKAVSLGASGSASVQNGWVKARRQGRYFFTRSFTVEKGKALEGDVTTGLFRMGYKDDSGTTQSISVSFEVKEDDPDVKAKLKTITAVGSIEDLGRLALNRKDLGGSVTSTKGTSSGGTLRVGAGDGAGSVEAGQRGFKNDSEIRDAEGNVTNVYEAGTDDGVKVKVKGHDVASVNERSTIRTEVSQSGKAKGQTLLEKSESDLTASAKNVASHPLASAQALYKGDTQALLKTTTVKTGANLEDDNYARLAELAKNDHDWREAGTGFGGDNREAWMRLRFAVKRAGRNNPTALAQLLQDFKSEGDDRRRRIVERASDIGSGNRFEFPDAIKDQKEVFDSLVVNDPTHYAAELVGAGKTAEALAELKSIGSRLDALSTAINTHAGEILPTILPDMNTRISKRKAQVRAETSKLTPTATPTALKPGVRAPEKVDEAEKQNADRKAQIDGEIKSLIVALQGNRVNENAKFAEVEALFRGAIVDVPLLGKVHLPKLSHAPMNDILPKLHAVEEGYKKWDQQIEVLKALYRERNENPEQANQYVPNRAKWNELNTRKE